MWGVVALAVFAGFALAAGGSSARAAATPAKSRRRWPVSTYRGILSPFGAKRPGVAGCPERFHAGADVGALLGDRIVAIDRGIVLSRVGGYELGAGLDALLVRHPDADYVYAEIRATVAPGAVVRAGDELGRVAKNSDGNSMLHLEAWQTGTGPTRFTPWCANAAKPKGLLDVGAILAALPHDDPKGGAKA